MEGKFIPSPPWRILKEIRSWGLPWCYDVYVQWFLSLLLNIPSGSKLTIWRTLSGFQMDLPLIQLIWTGGHQEQALPHIQRWRLEYKYFRTWAKSKPCTDRLGAGSARRKPPAEKGQVGEGESEGTQRTCNIRSHQNCQDCVIISGFTVVSQKGHSLVPSSGTVERSGSKKVKVTPTLSPQGCAKLLRAQHYGAEARKSSARRPVLIPSNPAAPEPRFEDWMGLSGSEGKKRLGQCEWQLCPHTFITVLNSWVCCAKQKHLVQCLALSRCSINCRVDFHFFNVK